MNRVITTETIPLTPAVKALEIPKGQAFYGLVTGYDFKMWLKIPTGTEANQYLIFPLDNPNGDKEHSVFEDFGYAVTGARLEISNYVPISLLIKVDVGKDLPEDETSAVSK